MEDHVLFQRAAYFHANPKFSGVKPLMNTLVPEATTITLGNQEPDPKNDGTWKEDIPASTMGILDSVHQESFSTLTF